MLTFAGYALGSAHVDTDNMENAQCSRSFPGSRPATYNEIIERRPIAGLPSPETPGWVRLAIGPRSTYDQSIQDGATFDAHGRMITLKSAGWIRLALRKGVSFASVTEPEYPTDKPYSQYYGGWGEGTKLGSSGFNWENMSRAIAPSFVLCVTASPTAEPTSPTATPTADPSAVPTSNPTATPTADPSAVPTLDPTATPTADPSAVPTLDPIATPTADPSAVPTFDPTATPT